MTAKGSLWSSEEVKCLLEIWADENIQSQLDNTHKNAEIYGIIREYLHARGYNRTIEQCRAKLKKMRLQYQKVRDAMRKSGSSTDEKDKFPWYDAVDSIIGRKPTSEPNVVESQTILPPISMSSGTSDVTHTAETSDSSPRAADDNSPRPADNRRKRKAKTDESNMMGAFMDMQKKQYIDFMQAEQLRQQQEKDSLDTWMKAQMELEERRLQAQREERQESNAMFMQMMSRLFDVMVPSSQQSTAPHLQPPPPPPPSHYYHGPPLHYTGTMAANAGSMRILIKGGKVVNDDFTHEADVYIENGIIQQVGKELMIPGGAKVIDASGKLVMPGGIDTSVHLQQSFMNATIQEDFYSGTKAALMGGTTMVVSLALPEQHCSLVDAYESCRTLADAKACCDYALHVGVTWWGPKVRNEMETLVREHGVNSFQIYMAYKDLMMLKDSELYQTLQTCKDIGAIARVHAENGELVAEGAREALDLGISGPEGIEISRPEELESEATHRAITIANRAHCPIYLVNVSSISAGDMIAAAKMQGKVVHAETTVAHAVLNGMQYYHQDWAHAAAHVIAPPLRLDPTTPNYLMGLLGNDTLSVVASEHRPFNTKQRALGKEDFTKIPHGVAGVQDRMSVIWERGVVAGKMDENRFVAVTSSNAAKIYNLYPRKGRIIPGADADVVVWDPDATRTISMATQVQGGDFNLYEGMRCHGVPLVTISRGRLVCENGVFMCAEGSGKFYPLRIFPDYLYKKMVQREKTQGLKGVDRDPYSGDVAMVVNSMKKELGLGPIDGEAANKSCARGHQGVRDLHESSFSLSGSQVDDHIPKRSSARILAPPGGRSSGIW